MIAERRDRSGPERLADDGCLHQHPFGFGGKGVDPRGDQRLDTRRDQGLVQGSPGDGSGSREHRSELFGIERRSSCRSSTISISSRICLRQALGDEGLDISIGERGQREHRGAAPGWPGGVALLDLGPGRDDDEQRQPRGALGEVFEERDERLVGPMEVLDHEDRRTVAAICSRKRRHAVNASSRWGGSVSVSKPTSGARRSLIQVRVCSSGSVSAWSSLAETVS